MGPRRILAGLVLLAAALAPAASPASAAKPQASPPTITSAVAVDSRTVDLAWTPTKGADHYVVYATAHAPVYTTSTSARVGELYPGDVHALYVVAESRRNQPLGTSAWVYVATPPEGPAGPLAWVDGQDAREGYAHIWTSHGIGCATFDLGVRGADGTYASLGLLQAEPDWWAAQDAGTTVTYAVRCQGSGGLWSGWSTPTDVTVE